MTRIPQIVTTGVIAIVATSVVCLSPTPAMADNIRDSEWHLKSLDIIKAQALSQGAGVIVAVIDSGVDSANRDLAGSVLPGVDLVGKTDGRQDLYGHGTSMAGLIAGHGANGKGILGIAPEAKILPVRNSLPNDVGISSTFTDGGFHWAAQHGAKVINASYSGTETPLMKAEVESAIADDIVVVAAAGNLPQDGTVRYPAALPGVVAVGGTDESGQHDPTSTKGAQILLSAPSSHIAGIGKDGTYNLSDGTSNASAIVAGVAALIRAKYPTMSAAEVVHRLTATATDKGPPGRDPDYGYGIVNPVAALTADVPPLPTTPSAGAIPQSTATPTADHAQADNGGLSPAALAALGVALLAVAAVGLSIAVSRRRRPR
jgi:type VII secretion-associated serine protease mycosin